MGDAMGIILTNDKKNIPPISDIRVISALPMAGRYRLIDFVLSNMANAGITNVGVATTTNYTSLMDHLKSGKPWDLDRKNQGLNILPPNMKNNKFREARGDADVLAGIYDYIKRSHQTYVILTTGTNLYNIDFNDVIDKHIELQSDITMVYKDMTGTSDSELSRFVLLDMDSEKRVTDIEIEPYYPKTAFAGMNIYVMERELLLSIIDECTAHGDHDFIRDAVVKKLDALRVYGYEYKGYMDNIDSLKAYYRNNMLFLNSEIRAELFNKDNPIYTKIKDSAPTHYGEEAVVENSFISDGCYIEGTVEGCIFSRGVRVEKGAVVKNSIIMQDSVIKEGVYLDHVVFDKEVTITQGRKLIGQENYPLAIEKGAEI